MACTACPSPNACALFGCEVDEPDDEPLPRPTLIDHLYQSYDWMPKGGRAIRLTDLSTSHIEGILRWLRARAESLHLSACWEWDESINPEATCVNPDLLARVEAEAGMEPSEWLEQTPLVEELKQILAGRVAENPWGHYLVS